jgi:hypothetical protein
MVAVKAMRFMIRLLCDRGMPRILGLLLGRAGREAPRPAASGGVPCRGSRFSPAPPARSEQVTQNHVPGAPPSRPSGTLPQALRSVSFSPPTAFCSLPSAWSALPSACFLSGCAAQSSGARADHQLLALKQFDGPAWRGIPTPHVSVMQIVRVHPMVPPGADASPEQLHHPGWCSDAPYSENSL